MRRATHRLVAVVAILIFCVAVAGPAAAVDDPITNETESEEPTYLIEIDDDGLFGGGLFDGELSAGGSLGLIAGAAALIYAFGASN